LKLNGTHQLLVYADDVNILGGRINTVEKNKKALVVASNDIGQEVNADKTKYMVMSRDQNAGRSRNIKIVNRSFGGSKISNISQKPLHIKILCWNKLRAD